MRRFLPLAAAFLALLALACTKEEPVISIDGQTEYKLSPSQVMLSIKVVTNAQDWDYDLGGAGWISESGKESDRLKLAVSENTVPQERSTVITFYAGEKGSAVQAKVSVSQKAAVLEPQIQLQEQLEVNEDASSHSMEVSTNQDSWEAEVTEGADWLSVQQSGSSLKVDVQPNPTEEIRRGRIRIYAPNKALALVFKDIVVSQKARVIEYEPVNLSENGTSNCYVITHRGVHSFDATVRGNGQKTSGLSSPQTLSPAGAKLVWQTVKGMIMNLSYNNGVITFEASKAAGSAVIAATASDGTIIWSWHIWHPAVEIEALRASTGHYVMNLNLGAIDTKECSITSHGMLYQWGRKDPFPYSPVPHDGSVYTMPIPVYDIDGQTVSILASDRYKLDNNHLEYSIAHPETCLSNNCQAASCRDWLVPSESNLAFWGNPEGNVRSSGGTYKNEGSKSFYDPCPVGWRVPPVSVYVPFTETGGYTWATGDTKEGIYFSDLGGSAEVAVVDINEDGKYSLADYLDGWWFWLDKMGGVKSYFPAATRFDGGYAMLMGSMVGLWANYWTNAASDDTIVGGATALSFSLKDYSLNYSITISPVSNGSRADAYSVRCIKE